MSRRAFVTCALGCSVALSVALFCESARAEEPAADSVEMRYPPSSVRWKLVVGGAAVTGAAYGLSYFSATTWSDVPGAEALKIPVVGPWVALVQNDCAADDPDCGFTLYLRGFLTIVDGLVQAGGVGLAGEGLFMTTEAVSVSPAEGVTVRPVPVVTANTTGIGVIGSF